MSKPVVGSKAVRKPLEGIVTRVDDLINMVELDGTDEWHFAQDFDFTAPAPGPGDIVKHNRFGFRYLLMQNGYVYLGATNGNFVKADPALFATGYTIVDHIDLDA